MKRLYAALKHPLGQAVAIVVGSYLVFDYGIRIVSVPVPNSVLIQFMLIVLAGVLVYVSDNEQRWRQFKEPIQATLGDEDKRLLRGVMLTLIPLLVGAVVFNQVRPKVGAAAQLRSIHPAPPSQITFRGRTMQLTDLENPLRGGGDLAEHYKSGRQVYYQNCLPCHGDQLDGRGHFAHGFNPTPLPFDDSGTIAQLTESFVFWRIAKGGIGLPREGTPWNSAMPAWEDFLTEDEIWAVIIFLYEQSGWQPRTWGESEAGGGDE